MFITVCSFGVSLVYVDGRGSVCICTHICSLVISKLISYPTTIRSIHLYNSTTQTCESYWRAHSCPDVCTTSSPGDRCTPTCRRPLTCLPPTPTLRGHEARFLSRRRRRRSTRGVDVDLFLSRGWWRVLSSPVPPLTIGTPVAPGAACTRFSGHSGARPDARRQGTTFVPPRAFWDCDLAAGRISCPPLPLDWTPAHGLLLCTVIGE